MTAHPKVTLVTCKSMPNLFKGEEGLLDELAARGCDPQIKVWNDPDVDWSEAGMVVVRSVSDYASDRPAFLEWTKKLRRVQNSADVLNWNTDKHYLKELAALGMPTIPTNWLEPEQNLSKHQIHTRFPAFGEFVVKPAVSSGVRDIGRYTTVDTRQRQAAMRQVQGLLGEGRSVMIQRYVEEIDLHGEISLVFFNGLVSHAVEKRSALHPASVSDAAVHEAVVTAEAADSVAWKWGEEIRRVLHGYVRSRLGHDEQFLFNRVDLVPTARAPSWSWRSPSWTPTSTWAPPPARSATSPTPSPLAPTGDARHRREGSARFSKLGWVVLSSIRCLHGDAMVAVVQLVEHLVVVQDVAGSSPVSHPTAPALTRRGFCFWSMLVTSQLTGQRSSHAQRDRLRL